MFKLIYFDVSLKEFKGTFDEVLLAISDLTHAKVFNVYKV